MNGFIQRTLAALGAIEISLCTTLVILQLSGGWNVTSSLLSAGFLLLTWSAGSQITSNLLPTSASISLKSGIGLVVGIFLSQVSHHLWLSLETSIESGAVWTVVSLGIIIKFSIGRGVVAVDEFSSDTRFAVFGSSAVVASVATGRWWLAPVSAAILVVGAVWSKSRPISILLLVATVSATVILSRSLLNSQWWYTSGNDAQYFESISWSLAKFGMFENPLFVGDSIQKYHWLIYSFGGVVSQVSDSQPWQILTLALPLVISSAAVLTFAGFLQSTAKIRGVPSLVCGCLLTAFTMDNLQVGNSSDFGNACLLAAFAVIFLNSNRSNPKSLTLLFLLQMAATFAKVIAGGGALLLSFYVAVRGLIDRRLAVACCWFATTAMSGLIGYLWFRDSSGASLITFQLTFSGPADLWGRITDYLVHPRVLVFVFAMLIALATGKQAHTELRSYRLPLVVSYLIGLALAVLFESYVARFPLIWATPLLPLLALIGPIGFETIRGTKHLYVWALLAGLWGWISAGSLFSYPWQLVDEAQSKWADNRILHWVMMSTGDVITRMTPVVMLIALVGAASTVVRPRNVSALGVLLVVSLGFNFGSELRGSIADLQRDRSWYEQWSSNSQPHASASLVEIGDFIRQHTAPETVIASNNFCCAGSDWLEDDLQRGLTDDDYLRSHDDPKWGGGNSLLVAHSQRRFFVQSPRFLTGYAYPSDELVMRLRSSVKFANAPDLETANQLRSAGVGYFVVNLNLTVVRDWAQYGKVLTSNSDFVLLQL